MDQTQEQQRAHQLVSDLMEATITAANLYGLVVKIDTVPKTPLAMGNYELKGEVYPRSRKGGQS